MAGCEILQAPAKMLQVDAIHRGTHANHWTEKVDLLLGVFSLQSIDQMQFGTDRPFGSGAASRTV